MLVSQCGLIDSTFVVLDVRATQRLGQQCDMANVIAVLRYMIGQRVQSHVDLVDVTCDTCNRAPNQRSTHSCGW